MRWKFDYTTFLGNIHENVRTWSMLLLQKSTGIQRVKKILLIKGSFMARRDAMWVDDSFARKAVKK
jgi:hypothetical protein